MIIDIKKFALSGKFGFFGNGVRKSNVVTTLGEPDDGADHRKTEIEITFAGYELFFYFEKKLFAIQIDNYDPSDEDSYSYKI